MKTLFTFFATLFLFASVDAKIVYLNNNLEAPIISENLYINWADTYAAASAGDTIYIIGSYTTYGNIAIDKPLTLIGPGYFLDQKTETQVNKETAEITYLELNEGADGTKLKGLSITGGYGVSIKNAIDNISFENCYLYVINLSFGGDLIFNNLIIKKCFIKNKLGFKYGYDAHISNLVFANNIIGGYVSIEEGSTGVISHNLFLNNRLDLGIGSSFEFADNIFLNTNSNDLTITTLPDASVHHNISLTGAFGNANNNSTAPQSTLFVTGDNVSDSDAKYMLSENSPAKGVGSNGTDIGPFGGPDPYRLSGLPNLPNIYELSTGGLVSGDELPVRIKIKQ